MKRTLLLLVLFAPFFLHAQPRIKNKKCQGLLWEISGNGLKKPSYLFGTMHVSSKLAFHLADSFYLGIRNADMVALETNPESWQEDMSKYDLGNGNDDYNFRYRGGAYTEEPNEYLRLNTLKFYKYDKKIERALYSSPSTINNLLYRTYGNESSDFEEDTYLDMYIYQCGKKWGKKVAGVEKYGESMKLMAEAYKDASKDKNRKDRNYTDEESYSANKLQEAYRSGNLDWLDSINKYNSFSAAFDEKFLYRRNEIQASSIDTILRSGQSLFVGVGAAHLPGNRGVIEMLRARGYTLRPVRMGARDSQHKTQVEKLRVPVQFTTQSLADGMYKVDIPGKFYKFGDEFGFDQQQYADMANGSYYMVTRIMTNAWMWGHSPERVKKTIDSLLYENIPGKIISKTAVVKNGYKGIELVNKPRRGDIQRYAIYTTPFEIVIFKMSGTGDYVLNGEEAKRFFSSIQIREYKPAAELVTNWKKFTPRMGGFSIDMPHEPYIGNDGSWIFDADDKQNNTQYRVVRSDIHNYHFVEEDTFDLGLMDESFAASEFIDKKISRKQFIYKGYPALDCKYRDKSGNTYLVRFIIQGPHYYSLITHGKQEIPAMQNFLNSFEVRPLVYPVAQERKDTSLYYSALTPISPELSKEKLDMPANMMYNEDDDDGDDMAGGMFRSKVIANDTTGEKIYVGFFKSPRYAYLEDSLVLDKENISIGGDTTWIVRYKRKYETPDKMKVWERIVSDTGSSRTLWTKAFYKDGIGFSLITQADTLTPPSAFVRSFYDSFKPVDTLTGSDPFKKKTTEFFEDFSSNDSTVHKRAVKGLYMIKMDSADFPRLKNAIGSLTWKEKRYLEVKKNLVAKMSEVKSKQASDYLRDLYYAAGDTIELQYSALETLLQQKTQYSFRTFRDIMLQEPPVLNVGVRGRGNGRKGYTDYSYTSVPDGDFMSELNDSLKLTRTILPDLLPLINLDDYERPMMQLLADMVDSNLVTPADYQLYMTKFLVEAKQELKKQAIAEKQKQIQQAEENKDDKNINNNYLLPYPSDGDDGGNDDLELYATLLLPAWESNAQVKPLFQNLLSSSDKVLRYRTTLMLLRNNKPIPDTMLRSFAKMTEYRYQLYRNLKKMKMANKFPAEFNTHLQLGESKLKEQKSYDKPDTLAYLDRLPATIKNRKGYVYFFKYKTRKDDPVWRIASVGLIPEDEKTFEFENTKFRPRMRYYYDEAETDDYDLTNFLSVKLKDDEPVLDQLTKQLRFMLYSKRKSARMFYDESDLDNDSEEVVAPEN